MGHHHLAHQAVVADQFDLDNARAGVDPAFRMRDAKGNSSDYMLVGTSTTNCRRRRQRHRLLPQHTLDNIGD